MTPNEMLDAVCRKFGLEHENTILFARYVSDKRMSPANLGEAFKWIMKMSTFSDEI